MEITPRVLHIYVDAYRQNKETKGKDDLYQIYLLSRWVWQKKVDIDKILNSKEEKKQMSDDAMLNQVKALNKLFGGEVKIDGNEE